ncbi:SIMPL domain-containing protein [Synechococcus sp. CS-602]|uniref:SIMPL domain-containing protein n=1 Tax=Synechococcaceae TaxID=1890426 RepID=UPI0008FF55BF|nr:MULTISPECIES: SIMPL domain-containing protein [Synechococcaceae]MCT4365037.1 SIMPL domain-containing protein [Candidatus Regnicoccus frigidus MAG-AL1]APD47889.1 SIMPL domain-containing protein [Synechococcus sp. SynAce01]MCT0203005.1 SIMPL domain-containing protein [Synechococcus sp. CS-603]MCT0204644.1 SIMPL domain-containing protein [Synechococcus sp. CS-602]MCT0245265.1 SIMPL domain-containing protein [Synechococcus sp. CS-601]
MRPLPPACWLSALGLWPLSLALLPLPALSQQVQLRCDGTLLEARGNAEVKRTTERLRFSLGLEAEAATAELALPALQERLAAVRTALQLLQVSELEVGSPSTWQQPRSKDRPELVKASLRLNGQLQPPQLQGMIRQVGSLPGVRLSPVTTEADPAADADVRRQLLRSAYQEARSQALTIAEVIGLRALNPLEVQIEGGMGPRVFRTAMADEAAPFDPAELAAPTDRLELLVRFCAN